MNSESIVPFRAIIEGAIGGGWGADEPAPGATEVLVIRGTDLPKAEVGNTDSFPRRYEDAKKVSKRVLAEGDLVIEISGGSKASGQATGRSLLITKDLVSDSHPTPMIPASFCRRVRIRKDIAEPEYAYFLLQDMYFSGRAFEYQNESTGIANFQFQYFLDAEHVYLPSLEEQRRIAWVLAALDQKIKSNRRLAVTASELGEAAFSMMFLATTSPAPPESLPDGWSLRPLGELAKVVMGQSPPGSSCGTDPALGPLMVQGNGGFGDRFPKSRTYTGQPTRLVPAGSPLMTVRAPVGAVNVAMVETCLGRGVAGFVSDHSAFTEWLVRGLERRWNSQESGTIFPAVNKTDIETLPVAVPPADQIAAFERAFQPVVAQMRLWHEEADTLAALRRTLLPKLVRGEVQVRAVEDLAQGVGATAEPFGADLLETFLPSEV